jgi:cytidine deaminase
MTKDITITIAVCDGIEHLEEKYANLLRQAQDICKSAYAPYSNFFVGAALLLENGEIVKGANQENAAYPSGMCAERTAMYWAGANYPNVKIEAVAVAARNKMSDNFLAVTPCGGCRQVMAEYENVQKEPIKLIMKGDGGKIYTLQSVGDLLPLKFDEASLTAKS